jgi:hypothetical protein
VLATTGYPRNVTKMSIRSRDGEMTKSSTSYNFHLWIER